MNSDGCVEKEELERVANELSKLGEVNNLMMPMILTNNVMMIIKMYFNLTVYTEISAYDCDYAMSDYNGQQ